MIRTTLLIAMGLLLLAACEAQAPKPPSQPEATRAPATRGESIRPAAEPEAPPVVKQAPFVRHCMKQDDCPEGLVCVATGPRRIECLDYKGEAPPRTGPGGRPIPPVGLLEGDNLHQARQGEAP